MSGQTFGLPGVTMTEPDTGSTPLKRLVVTASQLLFDPSGGNAKWFRVTVCGGGGGCLNLPGNSSHDWYSVAGGAETKIRLFTPSELVWPIQITIGQAGSSVTTSNNGQWSSTPTNGGTTSFGNVLYAAGGYCMNTFGTINSGISTHFALPGGISTSSHKNEYWPTETITYIPTGSSIEESCSIRRGTVKRITPTDTYAIGIDNIIRASPGVFNSPSLFIQTGMAGITHSDGIGESYMSMYGLGNYGRGAYQIIPTSGNIPAVPAGPGVCILEWAE